MTDPRAGSTGAGPPTATGNDPSAGGFAVVELFTSQGCSSCPPAEEVLSEIERDARTHGRPVFALGFHVDYWDYLGWPDPFGDGAYSARQEAYARAFGSGRLYTPQMIVNGTVEFIGSDRRQAAAAIASAVTRPPGTPVALSVEDADGGRRMVVDYQVGRLTEPATLNVALVERDLASDVAAGENAGRTLRQDNVVRAFTSTGLAAERGRVELAAPPDLDARRASVIGYVQHERDRSVVGAAGVDLGR